MKSSEPKPPVNLYQFKNDSYRLKALESRDRRFKVIAIATAVGNFAALTVAVLLRFFQ